MQRISFSFITTMGVLPWAGSEELWLGAAMALLTEGHRVSAYYPRIRGWAPRMEQLQVAGASMHPYGAGASRAAKLAYKLMRRLRPKGTHLAHSDWLKGDLVVISQGGCMDGLEWLERVYATGRPYAIVCQANMEAQWPDDQQAERLCVIFSSARRVCFVSAENERLFRIQTGYVGNNTAVIWNPMQPETPEHPLPWPSREGDIWKMAMVGRIEPFAKGQDLMIEVLSMEKWRLRNLTVTIFGKGPWEQTAHGIVAARKLNRVEFGGFATPKEIWSRHHMLALPSRHEGMSLAMLEAMWLGRPVIATAVAGAVSEIISGHNGILCAAPALSLWDAAMEEAWQRRNDWHAMGAAAATRIRERMQGDPVKRFAELLSEIATDRGIIV